MRSTVVASFLSFLILSTFGSSLSEAKLLQIVHTNDLHSYYEGTEGGTRGGYAALKATMDSIKAEAKEKGIETLTLDGGDFSDGTLFRYADYGNSSLKIMDQMGYDAIGIGNHDWLIGAADLDRSYGTVQPRTPFLAANFAFDEQFNHLARHIRPYLMVEKGGAKIAILGLTTDELIYKWRVEDGTIAEPIDAADTMVPFLKDDIKADFVFVLSHLGFDLDKELVKETKHLDLVVGSHSHTVLEKPVYAKDPKKRQVPIVQTGAHGVYVGDLLVDIEKGKPLKIIRYRLVEVRPDGPKDPQIEQFVKEARHQLEEQYGRDWLYEPIAVSHIPMISPEFGPSTWGDIYAEALRETARTKASLDIGSFFGTSVPPGIVTREMLYNFYPRTFSVARPYGWNIWKVKVPGWVIRLAITEAISAGGHVNTAGISYRVKWVDGEPEFDDFKIGGKDLELFKNYKLAVTEGVGRGIDEISWLLSFFFSPQDTGVPVWLAVEDQLKRMGGVVGSPNSTPADAPEMMRAPASYLP